MEYSDSYFRIALKDNIIYVDWLSEYVNDVRIIDNAIQKRLEIQGDLFYPMISDIRKLKGGNLSIRNRLIQPDGFKGVSALSVICSTKYQISQFNFYNLKHYLPMPSSLFTTPEAALHWIKEFESRENDKNNFYSFLKHEDQYFKNDHFELSLKDGVFYVDWLKNNYSEEPVDFIIKKKVEMCNGNFYPMFTDFSRVNYVTRGAMRRMAKDDAFIGVKASASLCKSNVQKALYKMYCALFKPKVPNKFFTNRKAALKWLSRFKTTYQSHESSNQEN